MRALLTHVHGRRERTAEAARHGTPDGENTVIVGHIANLEAATKVEIEEGDSAVFEPLGDSRYRLLAKLPASVWPQLVER